MTRVWVSHFFIEQTPLPGYPMDMKMKCLLSLSAGLLAFVCSTQAGPETREKIKEDTKVAVQKTKEAAKEVAAETRELAKKGAEKAKEVAGDVSEQAKELAKKTAEVSKEVAAKTKEVAVETKE